MVERRGSCRFRKCSSDSLLHPIRFTWGVCLSWFPFLVLLPRQWRKGAGKQCMCKNLMGYPVVFLCGWNMNCLIISHHLITPLQFKVKHLSRFSGSPLSVTHIAARFGSCLGFFFLRCYWDFDFKSSNIAERRGAQQYFKHVQSFCITLIQH